MEQGRYIQCFGEPVSIKELKTEKAVEIVEATKQHSAFQFVDAQVCPIRYEKLDKEDHHRYKELILLEVTVDITGKPAENIELIEPIMIECCPDDLATLPKVIPLRKGFPELPGVTLEKYRRGLSLKLYEDSSKVDHYLKWTAIDQLNRTSNWFNMAAHGNFPEESYRWRSIYQESLGKLVLPERFASLSDYCRLEGCRNRRNSSEIIQLFRDQKSQEYRSKGVKGRYHLFPVRLKTRLDKEILPIPENLSELQRRLRPNGTDIYRELRKFLSRQLNENEEEENAHLEARIILLLEPPIHKLHHDIYYYDCWVFLIDHKLEDLRNDFTNPDAPGFRSKRGIRLTMMRACRRGSSKLAATINRVIPLAEKRVTMIGVGELGYSVLSQMCRMGIGQWLVIDHGAVQPHQQNSGVFRQATVGYSKVSYISEELNRQFPEESENRVCGVSGNFFKFSFICDEESRKRYNETELFLDFSGSSTIRRSLAQNTSHKGRKASAYMPKGKSYSFFLLEDEERNFKLDVLEAQFYQQLISLDLESSNESSSLFDRTNSHDTVTLHGSLLSQRIRTSVTNKKQKLVIYQSDEISGAVQTYDITVFDPILAKFGRWTIVYNYGLLGKMLRFAQNKEYRESHGVLAGYFDTRYYQIYIVDLFPTPPADTSSPEAFLRGVEALWEKEALIRKKSDNQVFFIGDWYTQSSRVNNMIEKGEQSFLDDRTDVNRRMGYPGLLLIIGKDGRIKWILSGRERPGDQTHSE